MLLTTAAPYWAKGSAEMPGMGCGSGRRHAAGDTRRVGFATYASDMPKALPADLARRLDSITLTFTMERSLTTDLPAVQSWYVTATAHDWEDRDDEGDPRPEIVAEINIVKGSLDDGSLWLQLDAMEADLEAVATSVLFPDTGDLRPEVDDVVHAAVGSQLLILNSVTVHEPWRGYGVGVLLAGEAILALDDDAQCVATYPAPLDPSEGLERTRAVIKLERAWAQIGFKPLMGVQRRLLVGRLLSEPLVGEHS